MDLGDIIGDALKYPLSNLKKFLILGIILVAGSLYTNFLSLGNNPEFIIILGCVGFIFAILAYGYELKILKSSLAGFGELPEFNAWFDMFIDGIKMLIVAIVYLIPLILILIFGLLFLGLAIVTMGAKTLPSSNLVISLVFLILFILIYLIVILPILLMSLAHMAYNNGEISAAFNFSEIFHKISNIGWGNFIIWYIVSGVIYLVLAVIGAAIKGIFNLIHSNIMGNIVLSLIVVTYMCIYIYRSTALIYISGGRGYLECENCGGYYELDEGESPEDFDLTCNCGGKLNHQYRFDDSYGKDDSYIMNIKAPKESITAIKSYTQKMGTFNIEKSIDRVEDGYRFNFKTITIRELSEMLEMSFKNDGYILEEGTPIDGIYGSGNHVNRILVGGLSKRFRFKIQIYSIGEDTYLKISKAMSGWSGGYIAVRSLNKEFKRLLFKINSF
jgi:hypothetical protein